jgi:diguanylate cyclase (GGDEF)-like protein
VLISIRKQIDESEQLATRFQALVKAFLGLATAVPKTALPANPELSGQCKESLEKVTATFKFEPPVQAIDEAGKTVLQQIENVWRSNKTALDERDVALRDVITTVAGAINGLKGNGERRHSSLDKLADSFDVLSRIEDVDDLRRKLREEVNRLRRSVEEMRRESEESVRLFESQISTFEQRLDSARKDSGVDRLTRLGSRREAERYLQAIDKRDGQVCLMLFDIEGFREINSLYGTLSGDKLLQALAHMLKTRFAEEGTLFRWGSDEFLAIAEGSLAMRLDQCRGICECFADSRYVSIEGGKKVALSARVACGAASYVRGEGMEEGYRRTRESLEQNRQGLRR